MKKLYFIFISIVLLMILLLVSSFVFFEKEKHKSYLYLIEEEGKEIGYVKADYYKTEDSIIYKSTTFLPKNISKRIIHEKIVFDKQDLALKNFIRESKDFGVIVEGVYAKSSDRKLDFLTRAGSKFVSSSGIYHSKNTKIFNKDSILTYMPIVDDYDFRIGGAQSFDVIYMMFEMLPPAVGKIVFRSIRDEYINVNNKRIKTELLILKAKTFPEIHLWISKKDRKIVRILMPNKKISIMRVSSARKLKAEEFTSERDSYETQEVLFPSEDIALAGTLSIPKKEGVLPAVLLVVGDSPYSRENAGLYTGISDELADKGLIVLKFDRRGIAKSQGNNSSASIVDEIKDIENALQFITNHEKSDKEKIFIVTHSTAGAYMTKINFDEHPLKGVVLLNPTKLIFTTDLNAEYMQENLKVLRGIDKKYDDRLASSWQETKDLVVNTKGDYVFKSGRRVFVKRMGEILKTEDKEDFLKIAAPILVLHGKKDKYITTDFIDSIEKTSDDSGKDMTLSIMSFRELGHFLGKLTQQEGIINYYKTDLEIPETIRGWIKKCIESKEIPDVVETIEEIDEDSSKEIQAIEDEEITVNQVQ